MEDTRGRPFLGRAVIRYRRSCYADRKRNIPDLLAAFQSILFPAKGTRIEKVDNLYAHYHLGHAPGQFAAAVATTAIEYRSLILIWCWSQRRQYMSSNPQNVQPR
jgi:hypothetical protein